MASEMAKALSTTLYMGAARADATPEQLEQLRDRIDEMKAFINAGQYAHARLVVREVMGDGWVPGPDWQLEITE